MSIEQLPRIMRLTDPDEIAVLCRDRSDPAVPRLFTATDSYDKGFWVLVEEYRAWKTSQADTEVKP